MHKKERPMMSVTQLLHSGSAGQQILSQPFPASSISPTGSVTIEQLQQQQQHQQNQQNSLTLNLVNAVQHQQLLQQQQAAGSVSTSPVPTQIMVQNNSNNNCDSRSLMGTSPIPPVISQQASPSMVTSGGQQQRSNYPPNHPLSGSKHLCAICEDRASGKHYGVYSCEGCKGFFKRTVRKDLTYTCRDDSNQKCTVDKRQRNRCQFCRYQKCLDMGMKREAVQEERQRNRPENEVESSTPNTPSLPITNQLNNLSTSVLLSSNMNINNSINISNSVTNSVGNNNNNVVHSNSMYSPKMNNISPGGLPMNNNNDIEMISRHNSVDLPTNLFRELTLERIMEAQKLVEVRPIYNANIKTSTQEIDLLFRWIRHLPHFPNLPIEDQVVLVHTAWNELMIAELSYRSINRQDCVLILANGSMIQMDQMGDLSGEIVKRIHDDLVSKFKDMKLDLNELGCLRAAVLFNPALKKLKDENTVELLRDCVFQNLETHCRSRYPTQTTRFAKLVANRLPALRSIGLKCTNCLFYESFKRENNTQLDIDTFIKNKLQAKY